MVSTSVPIQDANIPSLALVNQAQSAQSSPSINQAQCISVGPLNDGAKAWGLAERLQAQGLTTNKRVETGNEFAGYWVTMDQFDSKAEAKKILQRLRDRGINDAYLFTDEFSSEVISLGLFSSSSRAEVRRDALATLGFESSIHERTRSVEKYWLDVQLKDAGQTIDPALLKLEGEGQIGIESKPCTPADD